MTQWLRLRLSNLPVVDFIDNPISSHSTMSVLKILADPVDEVILEDTLDQLVQ